MVNLIKYSLVVLIFSGTTFFLISSYEIWKIGEQIHGNFGILSRIEAIETQINATAKNTAQITNTLNDASNSWKNETSEELIFIKNTLPVLAKSAQTTLNLSQTSIKDINSTIENTNTQINLINPLLTNLSQNSLNLNQNLILLQETEKNSNKTILDIDQLILDPDISMSLSNINKSTKNIDLTTADVQTSVHSATHSFFGKLLSKIF